MSPPGTLNETAGGVSLTDLKPLRIRKWWHAGAEVTIRLTRVVGDDDAKLLHGAVHAFSKALGPSTSDTSGASDPLREASK